MYKTLTRRGLIVFAAVITLVTAFLTAIVISYEPPAFFGFVFGTLSGALWMSLFVLTRDYWGDN